MNAAVIVVPNHDPQTSACKASCGLAKALLEQARYLVLSFDTPSTATDDAITEVIAAGGSQALIRIGYFAAHSSRNALLDAQSHELISSVLCTKFTDPIFTLIAQMPEKYRQLCWGTGRMLKACIAFQDEEPQVVHIGTGLFARFTGRSKKLIQQHWNECATFPIKALLEGMTVGQAVEGAKRRWYISAREIYPLNRELASVFMTNAKNLYWWGTDNGRL